jgi:hypothetical protein
MSPTVSFTPPLTHLHLTLLLPLSVQLISIRTVLLPSIKHWPLYYKEKCGIESGEYRAFWEKAALKAIPTMCVLTIKKDKNLLPLCAKSCIVALGNHEDQIWSKLDRFAPVLCGNSLQFLVSLAIKKRRPLCQGDCKNAFCQGILPPEEITIVRPQAGDLDADPNEYWLLQRTLYGLHRSPHHWYNKINKILKIIGLRPSLEEPCLFTGCVVDPSNATATLSSTPPTLGLYVDNFVYFSEDPVVEALFCHLFSECCKVNCMGIIEWFLGVQFSWRITQDAVSVHLNQSGFAENLVKSFFRESQDPMPMAMPYRSGIPNNSIAPLTDTDESPAQIQRKEAY